MDFFNKLTGDGDKKPGKGRANATSGGRVGSGGGNNNNNKGPQFKNPFANVNLGGLQLPGGGGGNSKNFRGGGQSLGGSKPGRIIRIELPIAGPLGVKVEKRQGAKTAIVSQVLPDTQAAAAELQRGDVICVADTQGEVEMLYDDFLKLAASDVRPLVFDIRRIDGVGAVAAAGGSAVEVALPMPMPSVRRSLPLPRHATRRTKRRPNPSPRVLVRILPAPTGRKLKSSAKSRLERMPKRALERLLRLPSQNVQLKLPRLERHSMPLLWGTIHTKRTRFLLGRQGRQLWL